MLLLVGLGNPGTEYAGHRHNVGFMALDRIVERFGFGPWRRKFQGQLAEGRIGTEKVLALKPETFMNESGRAVGEAARFYKLDPVDVVVFYDELDLAFGRVRVKRGGGLAGHNGLRSMNRHIGPDFARVRIGINHPGDKSRVTRHVLGNFAKSEQALLNDLLDAVADASSFLPDGEDGQMMTRIAHLCPPPKSEKKKKSKPQDKAPADASEKGTS